MKIAYFDCVAGASGDMILGALVDAGLSIDTLRERLAALHLADFEVEAHRVAKNAFSATKVDVWVKDDVPERHVSDILHIVEHSDLSDALKAQASAIFRKMGEAEAHIHGASFDQVHLHELGGVDTIVDVVGALVGLDALGVAHVYGSPVPLGRGFVHGAHGQIPLPAPATVGLLKGVPIVGSPLQMETVTPTGAALLASLVEEFGPIPPMTLTAVGYGAGARDLPIPNVLRVLIGHANASIHQVAADHHGAEATSHAHSHTHMEDAQTHPHPHSHVHEHPHPHVHDEHAAQLHAHPHTHDEHIHIYAKLADTANYVVQPHGHPHPHEHPATHSPTPAPDHQHPQPSCLDVDMLSVLETNIDDLNPEIYAHVMARLFEAGALDVFFAPIQMKKNRPATLLRILCRPDDVAALLEILYVETSTLGIREHTVKRHALQREVHSVSTPYGEVQVKVAHMGDERLKTAPEYEDCRRLAVAHNIPLREVYLAAEQASSFETS